MDRLQTYIRKVKILRQIQSNKAKTYNFVNSLQNLATVIVSSFLTFIGFSGVDKITIYANWFVSVDAEKVEFLFNFLVFVLFVLVILHLVFRFSSKQSESERAIVSLSSLLNHIEDVVSRSERSGRDMRSETEIVRQKYESIIQTIPSNTDKEYKSAKLDIESKSVAPSKLNLNMFELYDADKQMALLKSLISNNEAVMAALKVVSKVDKSLYIGGGYIRDLVWDYLHEYDMPTPVHDVDVVYMNSLSATKEHDEDIEAQLRSYAVNVKWSVKNQARMHQYNKEEPYISVSDAISKWPEIATCIAVRLTEEGQLDIIAPHGVDELFRLYVSPTPHFKKKMERYQERISKKQWEKTWPKLIIYTNT
ncbi:MULTISPECIES: nucleotidyltransferase family protein [Vibrio]|uniref:nucleotidyltransferase family protein n=1 Tax=Vibrio TaxID=662 RepID=UPI000B5470EC|nr:MULTISPECIES: nucleotidyltransferase family protein [Vibrio]ASG01737.1 hypothetical protein CEG15_16515 [Vibrio anguillarum]ELH0844916.1 nucleotidyltransferase family protein [Vibrio cholerae]MDH7616806.1 nucleotidyltransferase family protein [Vibrio cholerae]GHX96476.1 nitrate reductase [Vibrio cholerae]HDZ9496830.1 nucleotidyltransferase family protein [Vibrio cholerae]